MKKAMLVFILLAICFSQHAMQPDQPPQLIECIICFYPLSDFVIQTTHCAHRFHAHCIQGWLQKKLTCPLCLNYLNRQLLTEVLVQRIYEGSLPIPQEIDMQAQTSLSDDEACLGLVTLEKKRKWFSCAYKL